MVTKTVVRATYAKASPGLVRWGAEALAKAASRDPLPPASVAAGGVGHLPFKLTTAAACGSPEFTNEVQHFLEEVLRWGGATSRKIDARLPGFLPMAARSGKSRQLWIARDQQSLG